MLEKLDTIDWANVHHSHGVATDFPVWLRELTSDDAEVRRIAFQDIQECSNHQGSIYDVTPYVVPFLIELIENDAVADRHKLINLLGEYTQTAVWELGRPESENKTLAREVYEATLAALPLLLNFLHSFDPRIRVDAFCAVLHCQNLVIVPALVEALAAETDTQNQIVMVSRLSILLDNDKRLSESDKYLFVAPLQKLAAWNLPTRLRYQAALRLTMILQTNTPLPVAEILIAAIADPEGHGIHMELSIGILCKALTKLPPENALLCLKRALKVVQYTQDAHTVAIALLGLSLWGNYRAVRGSGIAQIREDNVQFGELPVGYLQVKEDNSSAPFRLYSKQTTLEEIRQRGRLYPKADHPLDITSLTAEQRQVLQLVVETDMVWMLHSNLMELYGLPAERSQVRALLEQGIS